MPEDFKNAHGIIIDLEEEHHGFATHSVTGKVVKIIAERSEFPKGKRNAEPGTGSPYGYEEEF